jgi:membrane protease YdiL (CAAX protease family)
MLSMVLLTVVLILIERRKVTVPIRKHAGKGALVGLIVGIVWIGLSAEVLLATHQLTIAGANMIQLLWLWILSAFVNVVMQELLVRGYIYQLLKTSCNLPVAVVVSTALFALMHGGAFEAGLLPVANVVSMRLFTMTPSANALLSGGSCKIEGSVGALVLNVVLTLVFAIAARRTAAMRQAAQAEAGRTC